MPFIYFLKITYKIVRKEEGRKEKREHEREV
jgi:hypothetical protein